MIRQWVELRGELDHFIVFMELASLGRKPPNPFKYNSSWLKEGDFVNMLKKNGSHLIGSPQC